MRAIVSLYLVIGIVLLLIGFFATGDCPNKNDKIVNDVVFVLGWPVYLYGDVVAGSMTPEQWLHKQACEAGLGHAGMEPQTQPEPKTQP